jgi:cytochrome P450
MSAKTVDLAARVFADPLAYSDRPRMHAALTHLRATAPVSWVVDLEDYRPFWAITKHADVMAIERNNIQFRNSPRPFLVSKQSEPYMMSTRSLVDLDEPEHGSLRAIAADWFRPGVMRTLKARVDALAKMYVDRMLAAGPECDFVKQVSVDYPLSAVMWLLGLPDVAFPYVLGLTREWFGLAGSESRSGTVGEDQLSASLEAAQYFAAVITDRRERPTEDLGSAIANARIDGKLLPLVDMLSYFAIFATAGHDTVNAVISGGLLALIENPEQLQRLRDDPNLAPAATEEMIRWVTPTM